MAHCPTQLNNNSCDLQSTSNAFIASDPFEILDLCQSLTGNHSAALEIKLNKYFQKKTGAGVVFLITILCETEEALVQAVGDRILDHEMRFPITSKLFTEIEQSSTSGEMHLHPELRTLLRYVVPETSTYLTVPVFHPISKTVSLLTCIVDYDPKKEDNTEQHYTKLVEETFRYCLTTILNTLSFEEERRLKRQCQSLLVVARKLFSRLGDLNDLLREIMSEARQLTKAERCSLFLLDPDHVHLVAKVFDGVSHTDMCKEVRIAKGQGIAGHVAATGKVFNIRDAYRHPLFFKGMDETTGFKTRNILCFPIRDEQGIIGVAQLCNKTDGLYFDVFDEEVALAFSIYCGISLMHSLVYKKIQDAQARSKLSNELMIYHMKVSNSDIKRVLNCKNDHAHTDFNTLCFSPREIPDDETICYVLKMYETLGFIETFHIKKEILIRFLLHVQKGYRDTPYHNWWHAFTVTHFAYLAIINFDLIQNKYLTNLEGLALITSCLCHDLDHRGTNNSFQQKSESVLASLYSSEGSVMERHHLSQAICILNTEGCNILDGLQGHEYSKFLDLLKLNILSTDLAQHMRQYTKQEATLCSGFNPENTKQRLLLLSLLMTCCDLCEQTKVWSVTRNTAVLIYEEFFSQGDLEKSMGKNPSEQMDREKASIPDLQIQFINSIIIPVYSLLAKLFPNAQILVDQAIQNRNNWELIKPLFENQSNPLEVLKSPQVDEICKQNDSK